ncbi:hypothetical protein BC936DRAFT_138358 [Jimgerdemannia flammicorona]|uniref:Uncharacterized protein n=1 Tax=Jimgerdemannia flammicorona TaxID=994334 RepID=A0A433DNI5_9FUNG|nr:hypothetical protein BC936DRAFT_138358 [Jimgerdemannia flammicorona]
MSPMSSAESKRDKVTLDFANLAPPLPPILPPLSINVTNLGDFNNTSGGPPNLLPNPLPSTSTSASLSGHPAPLLGVPAPHPSPSTSTGTIKFRRNYETLLKEVLEEEINEEDEEDELLKGVEIDMESATAELSEELRAALEDRALADKYLANLRTFMYQRHHTLSSSTGLEGANRPNTPTTTARPGTPASRHSHNHQAPSHNPLLKILDAAPQNSRLVNGVSSLTAIELKYQALRIPELDLPSTPETTIKGVLEELYRLQDDLQIHLQGGPLAREINGTVPLSEKKKKKVLSLLEDVGKEVGLYEEFVKGGRHLNLDAILNEPDGSDEDGLIGSETQETGSGLNNYDQDSVSEISGTTNSANTPATGTDSRPQSPALIFPSSPTSITPPTKTRRSGSANSLVEALTRHPSLARLRGTPAGNSTTSLTSGYSQTSSTDLSEGISALDAAALLPGGISANLIADGMGRGKVEPWEAFRWTPLIKISDQVYCDVTRKSAGLPTVLAVKRGSLKFKRRRDIKLTNFQLYENVIQVSGVIAIGTTRGLIFVYDYSQNLKCILGNGALVVEVGAVTALAISSDHTTIASGHAQGSIIVWDISRPATPLRTIDPIPASSLPSSSVAPNRKEGHMRGTAILHLGFAGVKRSEIVSGDNQGMAFYHVLYKLVMVNATETTRILGRYHNLTLPGPNGEKGVSLGSATRMLEDGTPVVPKPKRPSTVFAMQPMPLGQAQHASENFGLVALLTPYKMIIVGLKPSPQTQFKYLKPKTVPGLDPSILPTGSSSAGSSLSGCLAWLPAMKRGGASAGKSVKHPHLDTSTNTDPILAFSWGNHLVILRVGTASLIPESAATTKRGSNGKSSGQNTPTGMNTESAPTPATNTKKNSKNLRLDFVKVGEWRGKDSIVGLQWVNRQILTILTSNEEMIVFDPKQMQPTENANIRTKELIYHDRYSAPLREIMEEKMIRYGNGTPRTPGTWDEKRRTPVEMAYFHSVRGYKGKLFLLGLHQLFVGTLLSWADRIIALVQSGNFLEGIALATSFYNGKSIQTVIGLPDDDATRQQVVGEKLNELLAASLNYAFSSDRDGHASSSLVLFRKLAIACIDACLSMNDLDYLFDTVYERYSDAKVTGVFLEVIEPYIISDRLRDLPPGMMKDLVDHYRSHRMLKRVEHIIWHINPQCLDIDQIVSMCSREGLYDAMMYVWNRSMNDYVSPVVEMLKVLRSVMNGSARKRTDGVDDEAAGIETIRRNAEKLFEYLKNVLTGRTYPDAEVMSTAQAYEARSAVYEFVFSGRCVVWPRIGGRLILTADEGEGAAEPTYPYLRLLLRFDTKRFLEALEVAFDDPWLNGEDLFVSTGNDDEMPGKIVSRQLIVNTLLDVMGGSSLKDIGVPPSISPSTSASSSGSDDDNKRRLQNDDGFKNPKDTTYPISYTSASTHDSILHDNLIYLYIFIARNLHKYTTFVLLSPSMLHKILIRLSDERDPRTREERQAAVQNLLTVYTPTDEDKMVVLYEEAGFWHVLEDVYRREKKYGAVVETYLKDTDRRNKVFDCVRELIDKSSNLTDRQRVEVSRAVLNKIAQLVDIDGQRTADMVQNYFGADHDDIILRLEGEEVDDDDEDGAERRVFAYLRGLLEPDAGDDSLSKTAGGVIYVDGRPVVVDSVVEQAADVESRIHERYIELMCKFDPTGVYHYLNTRQDGAYQLEKVLPACETYGVVDAVVWIMEHSGKVTGALEKVLEIVRERIGAIVRMVKEHGEAQMNKNMFLGEVFGDVKEKESRRGRGWTIDEQTAVRNCLVKIRGVLRVGTQLCENSSRRLALANNVGVVGMSGGPFVSVDEPPSPVFSTSSKMSLENESETLWFQLLDTYVEASKTILTVLSGTEKASGTSDGAVVENASVPLSLVPPALDSPSPSSTGSVSTVSSLSPFNVPATLKSHLVTSFKSYVQSILTSLLLSTSSPQVSLPRLLLRLIQSQAHGGTTFADFRDIFLGMLNTYKYEGQLLAMTNRLFEKDLFIGVQSVVQKRNRGWRPRKAVCEACTAPFLGMEPPRLPLFKNHSEQDQTHNEANLNHEHMGENVTTHAEELEDTNFRQTNVPITDAAEASGSRSGIQQDTAGPATEIDKNAAISSSSHPLERQQEQKDDILLFRCGHGYHRKCLELQTHHEEEQVENEHSVHLKCVSCHPPSTKKKPVRAATMDIMGAAFGVIGYRIDIKGKGKAVET